MSRRTRPAGGRRAVLAAAVLAAAVLLGCTVWSGPPATAADDDVVVDVTIPQPEAVRVSDAQLRWGLNEESGAGAFFGGCNFLSAGIAGSTGGARPWTAGDGLYAARAGDVRIEKATSDGGTEPASWATRCLDPAGAPVDVGSTESTTRSEVVVDGGVGTLDLTARSASVRWTGSFTVAFYGGMTYWSATDPVLEVADGSGTLTARLSGYGADRQDPGRWVRLAPRTVTLAVLEDVELTREGLVVLPTYRGVAVDAPAGTVGQTVRDATNSAHWGSFPQDFVDFQGEVGQASYWFTSGGARDRAKPATRLVVSMDARTPVTTPDDDAPGGAPDTSPTPAAPVNEVRERPAAGPRAAATPDDAGVAVPAAQVPAGAGGQSLAAQPSAAPPTRDLLDDLREDPVALSAAAAVALLGAGGGIGLRRGWVVLPWVR
ncbi:hypothetical protein [Cellulomonas sp.]|uniref:hypothetical protein n=1 Tax=Cellulomonas sp. TaxID=40001 RepID=UPI00258B0B9C|nr:hypothetical protein [Cellulomonas sp.]MCR6689265.1 hypothetical protein [Cellulomonas sp.]